MTVALRLNLGLRGGQRREGAGEAGVEYKFRSLGEKVTLESDFFAEDNGKSLVSGDLCLLLFGVEACGLLRLSEVAVVGEKRSEGDLLSCCPCMITFSFQACQV